MRVFVDTSALIAILDEDDVRHREAGATFRALVATVELVTHNYIHVETLAVTSRRLGQAAAQKLTDLVFPLMTTIWVGEHVHRAALTTHRASPRAISFVDQVSFAVMREQGIDTAFAFDADFEAQGFKRPQATRDDQPRRVSEATEAYGGIPPGASDLVSVSEIATRAGRPVNTIQSWRRRHVDFPTPVTQLAAGPIWSWPAIAEWISDRPPRRPTEAHTADR